MRTLFLWSFEISCQFKGRPLTIQSKLSERGGKQGKGGDE